MSIATFPPKKVNNKRRKKKYSIIFVRLQKINQTYQIKIPKSFLDILLQKRLKVNVYEKHNLLKDYSYFFLLKSLTDSGTLHDFDNQKPFLRKYFKVTRNTFSKIIVRLMELELVKLETNNLHLANFELAAEKIGVEFRPNYFTLNYNTTDQQTIYYLLFGLEIGQNQFKQKIAVAKKRGFNSSLQDGLNSALSDVSGISKNEIAKLSFDDFTKLLMLWQKKSFAIGTAHFLALHTLRVDCNRSLQSLRRDWFVKDFRTATYIKRKLQKLKIITLEKSEIIFSDCGNRMINVSKEYCDIYNRQSKLRGFRFVDQLHLNISFTM